MAIREQRITESIIRIYDTLTGHVVGYRAPIVFSDDFLGDSLGALWTLTATDAGGGGGSPSAATISGSGGILSFDVSIDPEAESHRIDFGDILNFDAGKDWVFEARASVDSTNGTGLDVLVGVASAHNATHDNVATNAWFRNLAGVWYVETDDGSTDLDDKLVSPPIANATYARLRIQKVGTEVRFYVNDARVQADTKFSFNPAAGTLFQPIFKTLKTGGNGRCTVLVDYVHVAVGGR